MHLLETWMQPLETQWSPGDLYGAPRYPDGAPGDLDGALKTWKELLGAPGTC